MRAIKEQGRKEQKMRARDKNKSVWKNAFCVRCGEIKPAVYAIRPLGCDAAVFYPVCALCLRAMANETEVGLIG